jgi:GTP-binding protein HflX
VGKSTLFNKMTSAEVYADDRLFATLDPTLRRLRLVDTQQLILADTVGFIRQLPHDLVESFSSTLEETRDAELLLHVVDAAAVDRDELMAHVDDVLNQIGAQDVPQLIVYNKIDKLDDAQPRLERDQHGEIKRLWLSAHTGAGLDLLRQALQEYFPADEPYAQPVN